MHATSTFLCHLSLSLAIAGSSSAQFLAYPDETLKISHVSTANQLDLTWYGHAGRAYFIKHSPTLEAGSWHYLPFVKSGQNTTLGVGVPAPGPDQRFFARTVITPSTTSFPGNEDFDGDGVSNMDEIQAGLDPLVVTNVDTDGMADDWERVYFGDLSHDGSADTDGDGLTDAQEFAADRHPNTKIIYGTVIFYWKYENLATKTV